MKKWANELNRAFSKEEDQMANNYIPGHKENANQNYIKISPHSYQNSYHQKHKQQHILARHGERETLSNMLLMGI
jgi:hypothetical protein